MTEQVFAGMTEQAFAGMTALLARVTTQGQKPLEVLDCLLS